MLGILPSSLARLQVRHLHPFPGHLFRPGRKKENVLMLRKRVPGTARKNCLPVYIWNGIGNNSNENILDGIAINILIFILPALQSTLPLPHHLSVYSSTS